MRSSYRAIGMYMHPASGGVRLSFIETDGYRLLSEGPSQAYPYPKNLREKLYWRAQTVLDNEDEALVEALDPFCTSIFQHFVSLCPVPDLLALHHLRFPLRGGGKYLDIPPLRGSSLQKVAPPIVVWNFQQTDIKAGGKGAPLTCTYFASLLRGEPKPACIASIEDVTSMTCVEHSHAPPSGQDVGPGLGMLDDFLRHYRMLHAKSIPSLDELKKGLVHGEIVRWVLSDPFFTPNGPKALDPSRFPISWQPPWQDLPLEDGIATISAIIAQVIFHRYSQCKNSPRLYLGGRGRQNPIVSRLLKAHRIQPLPVEDLHIRGAALGSQAIAFLGVRRLRELPGSYPTTTGVGSPTVLGKIQKKSGDYE